MNSFFVLINYVVLILFLYGTSNNKQINNSYHIFNMALIEQTLAITDVITALSLFYYILSIILYLIKFRNSKHATKLLAQLKNKIKYQSILLVDGFKIRSKT